MSDGYPSTEWLEQIRDAVDTFLPTMLPEKTKPKIEAQIVLAYKEHKLFDLQWAIRCHTKDIEISHLLGNGDKVLPHLVYEYASLGVAMERLHQAANHVSKFQQIKPIITTQFKPLTRSMVQKMLVADLQHLSKTHNVEFDLKLLIHKYHQNTASISKQS